MRYSFQSSKASKRALEVTPAGRAILVPPFEKSAELLKGKILLAGLYVIDQSTLDIEVLLKAIAKTVHVLEPLMPNR